MNKEHMVEKEERNYSEKNDLFCTKCFLIDDKKSELLMCDGGCLRSFHLNCLNMTSTPDEEIWKCDDCQSGRHPCFICAKYGEIDQLDGIYQCKKPNCGKFYHWQCASSHKGSQLLSNNFSFYCPCHCCNVCSSRDRRDGFLTCILCPKSFHPNCVPPSARFNTVALVCNDHNDICLPQLPDEWDDKEKVQVDHSSFQLPMFTLPHSPPLVSNKWDPYHFRLPQKILKEVRSKPPHFQTLRRNIYVCKLPKDKDTTSTCECKVICGDDCINRIMQIECHGAGLQGLSTLNGKPKSVSFQTNCNLNPSCGNRSIQELAYPKLEYYFCGEKGWGLRSPQLIQAGNLVIEYMGEVIDEQIKEKRLIEHRQSHPQDMNMYVMELGGKLYIDARIKGNLARFINHSCDPNCWLQKWRVNGNTRIAVFAINDIPPMTELTYDYQFHTNEAADFYCCCGSTNCRGTLAPQKRTLPPPVRKLSKKQMLSRKKVQKNIDKRHRLQTIKRLSLTCPYLPGSKMTIRAGPSISDVQYATKVKLFLGRNVRVGFDMLQRKQLRENRNRHKS